MNFPEPQCCLLKRNHWACSAGHGIRSRSGVSGNEQSCCLVAFLLLVFRAQCRGPADPAKTAGRSTGWCLGRGAWGGRGQLWAAWASPSLPGAERKGQRGLRSPHPWRQSRLRGLKQHFGLLSLSPGSCPEEDRGWAENRRSATLLPGPWKGVTIPPEVLCARNSKLAQVGSHTTKMTPL